MSDFIVIKNSKQLEQFASDVNLTDAAIPTAAKFSAWKEGDYSRWILRSHSGIFKITGYDSGRKMLTIRKMKLAEKIKVWLGENKLVKLCLKLTHRNARNNRREIPPRS